MKVVIPDLVSNSYFPAIAAVEMGFFKEEGLDVEINDFGGGAKSLQALIGGSVDVVTGAYEHTIRMQAKGQDVRAGRWAGQDKTECGIHVARAPGAADNVGGDI